MLLRSKSSSGCSRKQCFVLMLCVCCPSPGAKSVRVRDISGKGVSRQLAACGDPWHTWNCTLDPEKSSQWDGERSVQQRLGCGKEKLFNTSVTDCLVYVYYFRVTTFLLFPSSCSQSYGWCSCIHTQSRECSIYAGAGVGQSSTMKGNSQAGRFNKENSSVSRAQALYSPSQV